MTKLRRETLQVLETQTCKGDMELNMFYSPSKKCFYRKARKYGVSFEAISIPEAVEEALEKGTSSDFAEIVSRVPAVWKLITENIKLAEKLIFKTGDQVCYMDHDNRIEILDVGPIFDHQKVCDNKDKKSKVLCRRTFYRTMVSPACHCPQSPSFESNFWPITKLSEWQLAQKVVNQVKLKLKKEGIVGATIAYGGKVYRF